MTDQPVNPPPIDSTADHLVPPAGTAAPRANGQVPSNEPARSRAVDPTHRVEELEAEVADWQRRAVIWRERALSTQSVNEALAAHLEDLRAILQPRTTPEAVEPEWARHAEIEHHAADPWWTRVFRRAKGVVSR